MQKPNRTSLANSMFFNSMLFKTKVLSKGVVLKYFD